MSDIYGAMFGTVLNSFNDILKFELVAAVNTGNKTRDSLLNGLFLSLIAILFKWLSPANLIEKWKNRNKTTEETVAKNPNTLIDLASIEACRTKIVANQANLTYLTWLTDENPTFSEKLATYYMTIYSRGNAASPMIYDFGKDTIYQSQSQNKNLFSALKKTMTADRYDPVYITEKDTIALIRSTVTDAILIAYTDIETVKEFIAKIAKSQVVVCDEPNKDKPVSANAPAPLSICNENLVPIGYIYSDRTMDKFVSKHKVHILRCIDSFTFANAGESEFNGYGSYNFGMMLFGEPGTGKTMIVKALANRIKRDVVMVDMRKIKTKSAFESLFKNHQMYIYFLDEFDYISGILKDRENKDMDDKEAELTKAQELRMLKERCLEINRRIASTSAISADDVGDNPGSADKKKKKKEEADKLAAELKELQDQIKDHENILSLDTVLTVLDGIKEMRGRIIIAATNHIDKIDSALMRPGRFDLKIKLSHFDSDEIRELMTLMFQKQASRDEMKLIRSTKYQSGRFTPAQLISIVTQHRSVKAILDIIKE